MTTTTKRVKVRQVKRPTGGKHGVDGASYPTMDALTAAYPRCPLYHGFGTFIGVGVDEVTVKWYTWVPVRRGFAHKMTTIGTNYDGRAIDDFEPINA